MRGLGYPARPQGEAMVVDVEELVSAVGGSRDLPGLAVGHEDFGPGAPILVVLGRTDDADDFPRAEAFFVRLVLFVLLVLLGLEDQEVRGAERPATVGADLAAGGEREEDGVGDDLVGGLGTARGNDLVELQDDLGADVQLPPGVGWLGELVGGLGAGVALPELLRRGAAADRGAS